jgi:hypothetical protein
VHFRCWFDTVDWCGDKLPGATLANYIGMSIYQVRVCHNKILARTLAVHTRLGCVHICQDALFRF